MGIIVTKFTRAKKDRFTRFCLLVFNSSSYDLLPDFYVTATEAIEEAKRLADHGKLCGKVIDCVQVLKVKELEQYDREII